MQELTKQDVLKKLRSRISCDIRCKELAEQYRVSQSFMSAVLNGHKRLTDTMLKSIGVERRVIYVVVDGEGAKPQ